MPANATARPTMLSGHSDAVFEKPQLETKKGEVNKKSGKPMMTAMPKTVMRINVV